MMEDSNDVNDELEEMTSFLNRNFALTFGSNIKKLWRAKPPDCCLFSESGTQFKIHRELLGQTAFLRKIANSAKDCCNVPIEIFCPCSDKELSIIVEFLYTGKIICDDVEVLSKSIDNLKEIFGFPNELPLWPEENNDFIIKEEPCDQAENINDDQGENGIDTRSQEPKDDLPVEHLNCSNGKTNPEVISTNDLLDDVTNPEQESIAQAVVDDIENSAQIDGDENSEKPQPKKSLRSSSKEFKCQECTASFYAKENLNQHINGYHRKLKPYLCEYCKKAFTIKDNLKRHIKLAHQAHQNLKPHKCIECEKTFSWKQGLHRHVSTAHLKLEPSKPVEVEEKKAGVDLKSVEDLDPFSKDDEDQFKALLSEEKSSENMVILINNLSFTFS